WVGKQIISLTVTIEGRYRIWRAGRLTKRMEKVPGADLESWLVKHEKPVNRVVDDLLELSSYAIIILFTLYTLIGITENFSSQEYERHRLPMARDSKRS